MPDRRPASLSAPSSLANPQQPSDLLLYRLAKVAAASGRLINRLCERGHGITRREWGVLMWLEQEPGLQPSVLAERLELDRARISRAIRSLQTKGLVARAAGSANRREASVHLTEAGAKLHAELWPQIRAINLQLLGDLSASGMETLDQQLQSLLLQVQQLEAQAQSSLEEKFPSRRHGSRGPLRA